MAQGRVSSPISAIIKIAEFQDEEKLDNVRFPRNYSRKNHISQLFIQYPPFGKGYSKLGYKQISPLTSTITITVVQS